MGRASYDVKLDWAEQHLDKLETAIRDYSDSHPYALRERMKFKSDGKYVVFEITEQPSDDIALIAGDFLYNVRAALDHIAGCMVPAQRRGRANYPVLWQGVWEPSIPGEHKQRKLDRQNWIDCTGDMPDEVIAIIKANQPPDLGENVHNSHTLAMLNRLRNRDAHAKLTAVSTGLLNAQSFCVRADGSTGQLIDSSFSADRDALKNGAVFKGIPDDVVEMYLTGTVEVMISAGDLKGGYSVRETFRPMFLEQTRTLINMLRPFDRVNA